MSYVHGIMDGELLGKQGQGSDSKGKNGFMKFDII